MSQYKLIILVNAVEGQEEEFNTWYNETHLKEVLSVPGFVSAQRFQTVGDGPAPKYVAIYNIEADDLTQVQEEFTRRSAAGEIALSPALDTSNLIIAYVEPITEVISAS